MRAVSLFAGAGGLDLGAVAAGFDVMRSIELDAGACSTLQNAVPPRLAEAVMRQVRDAHP